MNGNNQDGTIVRGIGFLLVAAGLVYCLVTGQAETMAMEIGAGCVAVASLALGVWQCVKALRVTGGR